MGLEEEKECGRKNDSLEGKMAKYKPDLLEEGRTGVL